MKRITRPLLFGAALVLAALSPAGAQAPSIRKMELSYSVAYEEKNPDMASRPFAQRILDVDQPRAARIVIEPGEAGRGRMTLIEEMNNNTTRASVFEYAQQPELRLLGMSVTQKDNKGRVFRKEYYDLAAPAFHYPQDLLVAPALWLKVQVMEFAVGDRAVSFIYMNNILMAHVSIETEARESVTAPAGTFECFRVRIIPSASEYFGSAVGSLVQRFIPSYTIWVEAAPPHRIIRCRGLLGQMPSTIPTYYNWELTEAH